jgi:molecular chaperone DnaJ
MKDYYDILGVSRNASDADLKKAYRQLAMKYHPDRNTGSKESEEKFKEINEAYSCLCDTDKRNHYDRFGTSAGFGAEYNPFGAAGFNDIFEDIFGDFFGTFSGRRKDRPTKGDDQRYDLNLTLVEAAFGTEKVIEIPRWIICDDCKGTGASSGKLPVTCTSCKGTGQIRFQQGFFSVSKTCGKCNGSGRVITDPCKKCKGFGKIRSYRTISVKIPPGVDTGSKLRMTGEGELGSFGGHPGDLYIMLSVEEHEFLKRDGNNLYCEIPISFSQAVLGAEIEVANIDGVSRIKIPPGTPSGKPFHIRGKGMPRIGSRSRGDQIVIVNIEVPKHLTVRQKELLEEFTRISGDEVSSHGYSKKGFKGKLKDLFAGMD